MKRIICSLLTLVLLLTLTAAVSAAEETWVTDGLVALYDGIQNTRDGHSNDTEVWEDLSGNKIDFELDFDETNFWLADAMHVDGAYCYFDDAIVDLVNGDTFTVEIVLRDLNFPGTSYISYIISDNDYFSMFLRMDGDYVEFKANNNPRPKVQVGTELTNNSTLTVTFDVNGSICMYIDGECIDSKEATGYIEADDLFLGHIDPARIWDGDVGSIRFYDRALTAEEVAANSAVDQAKYFAGTYTEENAALKEAAANAAAAPEEEAAPAVEEEAPAEEAPAAEEAPVEEASPAEEAPAAEDAAVEEAPAAEEAPAENEAVPQKGGCGSMIGGVAYVLCMILGCAWMARRKDH